MSVKKMLFTLCVMVLVGMMAAPVAAATDNMINIPQEKPYINPTCEDLVALGYIDACDASIKFDPPVAGAIGGITISNVGSYSFDWSAVSSVHVKAVIVKDGESGSNVYFYPSVVFSDTGLLSPGGHATSHIVFCYDRTTNVPEFPTLALPMMMIIGLLGAILVLTR